MKVVREKVEVAGDKVEVVIVGNAKLIRSRYTEVRGEKSHYTPATSSAVEFRERTKRWLLRIKSYNRYSVPTTAMRMNTKVRWVTITSSPTS